MAASFFMHTFLFICLFIEFKVARRYYFYFLNCEVGSVGTMDPGPTPLASRFSSRVPKGLGPEASWPRNARSILRPGVLRGLDPKVNRPRNARPILRPGISYSGCLLTQVLTFSIDNSIKRSCQPALHVTSVSSPMN